MAKKTTTPAEDEAATAATSNATADTPDVEEAESVESPPEPEHSGPEQVDAPAPADTPPGTQEPPQLETPDPAPQVIERRGPGFVPLVLGGIVAGAIGYGVAYYMADQAPGVDIDTPLAEVSTQLENQSSSIAALTERTAAVEAQIGEIPEPAEAVDLTPLTARIDEVAASVASNGEAIQGLTDRVAYLETLPLGEEGADNTAAINAAVAQLRAQMQAEAEALAAQQAANASLTEELQSVAAAAEERIAAAEARAEARVGGATAQAAFGQLQIAVATGAPFAGALADVAEGAGVEPPEALTAAAETGVPTLRELQTSFPALAREALPIAIRETSGEGAMNRVTAFLQSQVGGRSLEPREGDDPDAILSRAEADVQAGDISAALRELDNLPSAAQAVMAPWVEDANARLSATDAMAEFAAVLDASN